MRVRSVPVGGKAGAAFLILATLLGACSTAPKNKSDEVAARKNRAAEYTASGNAYYGQAQYAEALSFFNLALADNIAIDNEGGVARSYNSIGKVLMATGDLGRAEESFRQALALARRLEDPSLVSQSANNLGEVYLEREDAPEALRLFEEALAAAGPMAPRAAAAASAESAVILHNIGSAQKKLGRLDQALDYLNRALAINGELKRHAEMASNHYMIASVLSKKGEFDAARAQAESALRLDKQVENSPGIARDLLALGLISARAGRSTDQYEYLRKSWLIYQTLGLQRDEQAVLTDLADVAERLGKTAEAASYRQRLGELGGHP